MSITFMFTKTLILQHWYFFQEMEIIFLFFHWWTRVSGLRVILCKPLIGLVGGVWSVHCVIWCPDEFLLWVWERFRNYLVSTLLKGRFGQSCHLRRTPGIWSNGKACRLCTSKACDLTTAPTSCVCLVALIFVAALHWTVEAFFLSLCTYQVLRLLV